MKPPPAGKTTPKPPAAYDETQLVIGAALIGRVQEVRAQVSSHDCADPKLAYLFRVIEELDDAGRPVNVHTVASKLRETERAGCEHALAWVSPERGVDGKAFLNRLKADAPENGDLAHYLTAVKEAADQRHEAALRAKLATAIQTGATPDELEALLRQLRAGRQKSSPKGTRLRGLQKMEFPPPKWAVPNIIPEGLTLYVGPEKIGKSLLMLHLGYAVAAGGMALSSIPVEQGGVLYVSMEDGLRRVQDRVRKMVGDHEEWPEAFDLHTEWRRLDEGGLPDLDDYLSENPHTRLVVFDTLSIIRPQRKKGGDLFGEDYAVSHSLKRMADKHHTNIVVIHHVKKRTGKDEDPDWTSAVSGTRGLSAAADATLLLDRKRGEKVAVLKKTGRDVDDGTPVGLAFDPVRLLWSTTDAPPSFEISNDRKRAIVDHLLALPEGQSWGVMEIATATGFPKGTVGPYAAQLAKDGVLTNDDGRFSVTAAYRHHVGLGTSPQPLEAPDPNAEETPLPEPPPAREPVRHLFEKPSPPPAPAELVLPLGLPPPEDDLRRRTWARAVRHGFPAGVSAGQGYWSAAGEPWWRDLCEQAGLEFVRVAGEELTSWDQGVVDE